jgi:hypothetical protein
MDTAEVEDTSQAKAEMARTMGSGNYVSFYHPGRKKMIFMTWEAVDRMLEN